MPMQVQLQTIRNSALEGKGGLAAVPAVPGCALWKARKVPPPPSYQYAQQPLLLQ
jgi:hypothetical protein